MEPAALVSPSPAPRSGATGVPTRIQVFGVNDYQDTRKALSFFAERPLAAHFVDLAQRPAAKGASCAASPRGPAPPR